MAGTLVLSKEIRQLMAVFELSAADLAKVLDTDRRTVYRWLADETYPQHESRKRLDALGELERRLEDTFSSHDAALLWLRSASGYFGLLRPLDALLRGRVDAVDAALEALDSGVFV